MYINMYINILIYVLTIIYIYTIINLLPVSFAPAAVASARCKSHPHRHRRPRGPRGRPRSLRAVPVWTLGKLVISCDFMGCYGGFMGFNHT